MSNISVIGAGYVGLSTAACFAELGHNITLIEIDPEKLTALKNGLMPISEPGLNEMWQRNKQEDRINVTNNHMDGLLGAEFAFIAVGTPAASNGKPDLKWVRLAAKNIAEAASGPMVIVIKSTVPIGTAEIIDRIVSYNDRNGHSLPVVSNPEFLREGAAIYDFMHPSRVVIGSSSQEAIDVVSKLYKPLDSPIITCDNRTAEMSKYACNAFLATRISFMNEIALLCDEYSVDIVKVAKIMGLDPRFGSGYLNAGLGWGGSCLPKDLKGLIHMAKSRGFPARLLRAVQQINQQQVYIVIRKLHWLLGNLEGKTIGILGLAFKPNSDDVREARSLLIISLLENEGCRIKAYDPDPTAMQNAGKLKIDVTYCANAYEVAKDSDAIVLVTEWEEFKELDMPAMASMMNQPIIVDGRNLYDPDEMIQAGFLYEGIGRCSQRTQETRIGIVQ
ncbi:MAG TPA: UDP-glucose/GDP-mannose dehydrogenase family protein [Dehalococcoidia bacterium]|nr:UDP-glucose/GDP-mannose dehydrogenase family protein [Dehalococcoidia bacterium]